MTKQTPNGIDRIESAANISLVVTQSSSSGDDKKAKVAEVPISRLDTTKDIEIEEIRESSLKATGYSITAISYSGTMMFKGSTLTRSFGDVQSINNVVYDKNGVPTPASITITHDRNGQPDSYQTVLVTSDSYEVRNEEVTETAFDWVAMDRTSDQPDEGEETDDGTDGEGQ
jgi:hypothetical protein